MFQASALNHSTENYGHTVGSLWKNTKMIWAIQMFVIDERIAKYNDVIEI